QCGPLPPPAKARPHPPSPTRLTPNRSPRMTAPTHRLRTKPTIPLMALLAGLAVLAWLPAAQARAQDDAARKEAQAIHERGVKLLAKKALDSAVAEFRKAIEVEPRFVPARVSLSMALREKKDLEGAVRELRKALELDPKARPAHVHLGLALFERRDLDAAL